MTSAPPRCSERSLSCGCLFGTRFIGLGSSARPPACPELPTLLFHGPSLAPRSQARLHGRSAHEAASDPRPCPELRPVPRPSIEGTAAAQASVLLPPRKPREPRWIARRGNHFRPLRPLRVFDHVPRRAGPSATYNLAPCPIHSEDHSSPKTDALPSPRSNGPSQPDHHVGRAAADATYRGG